MSARRPFLVSLCAALAFVLGVLLNTAAAGETALITTERVAGGAVTGIGLWALYTAQQFFKKLTFALDRLMPRIEVALWGPEDNAGVRSGGLVGDMKIVKESTREIERLSHEVGNAAVLASTAADAVRALQAEKKEARRMARTRKEDRDDG